MSNLLLVNVPNRPLLTAVTLESDELLLRGDELLDGTLLGTVTPLDSARLDVEIQALRSASATRFHQEAMLTRAVAALLRNGALDEARRVYSEVRQLGGGLDLTGALAAVRGAALLWDRSKRAGPGYGALIWGLQNEGNGLYETLAAVAQLIPHEVYPFTVYRTPDFKLQVVRELLAASGITHMKTVDTAEKLVKRIIDVDLNRRRPNGEDYTALAPTEITRAKALANEMRPPGTKADAYNLFQLLSRIAAYSIGGLVRFRSSWMKGARVNADAIPGASTKADEYMRVLREHVLELEQGHSGGMKSRTYRLKVELQRGLIHREEAARWLGVELNAKLGPTKVERNRGPVE